jgi:hypothetical protein
MRSYLVFAGYAYYPDGGWNDFICKVDWSESVPLDGIITKLKEENKITSENWAHIVCLTTLEVVKGFGL